VKKSTKKILIAIGAAGVVYLAIKGGKNAPPASPRPMPQAGPDGHVLGGHYSAVVVH